MQEVEVTLLIGLAESETSQVYAPASPDVTEALLKVADVCPETGELPFFQTYE
ncbi:hypothetical protein ECZC05_12900 [Escherichia coli]|nr:hypothetical protein ECZC02_30520 [Escherichia coli]GJH66317.1 hypothetical protein ECZC05_12900 [Escherichia coli]GJH79635.1 hypothetical protein ECZC07_35570 [Escherichia coli]GJH83974.1 hypothetical protein ECZC08_25440 [Escherichia coli]GJH97456.1 hypothetical protein ECZC10_53040 [Escherichia coli]